jgi:hypothetical protein
VSFLQQCLTLPRYRDPAESFTPGSTASLVRARSVSTAKIVVKCTRSKPEQRGPRDTIASGCVRTPLRRRQQRARRSRQHNQRNNHPPRWGGGALCGGHQTQCCRFLFACTSSSFVISDSFHLFTPCRFQSFPVAGVIYRQLVELHQHLMEFSLSSSSL